MRILTLSDLHLEFMEREHPAIVEEFVHTLDPMVDVLILAGDITVAPLLSRHLELFRKHFPKSDIIYVPGNHEYYGSTFDQVHTILTNFESAVENFHWLRPGITVERDGQRFIGATLWYPKTTHSYDSYVNSIKPPRMTDRRIMCWSDFRHIADAETIFDEAEEHADWLCRHVRPGDVVVTHMLPSPLCVTERWQDEPSNIFFVHDLTDTILEKKPGLWIHGHTHDSTDHVIGQTRIVCNPRDYHPMAPQKDFDKDLIITL